MVSILSLIIAFDGFDIFLKKSPVLLRRNFPASAVLLKRNFPAPNTLGSKNVFLKKAPLAASVVFSKRLGPSFSSFLSP